MSETPAALAKAWAEFAAREHGEVATRIWGLWSATATPFYVFVVRPDMAAIRAHCVQYGTRLSKAGITAPVPPHFLHITVQSLGNEGESGLTATIASDLADAVADALRTLAPFTVRLAQVGPFGSGVFIAVEETEARHPLSHGCSAQSWMPCSARTAFRYDTRSGPIYPIFPCATSMRPILRRPVSAALSPLRRGAISALSQ